MKGLRAARRLLETLPPRVSALRGSANSPSLQVSYNRKLATNVAPAIRDKSVPSNQSRLRNGPTQRPHRSFSVSAISLENKQTPLYDVHVSKGAKLGPFAGFDMPLEYKDQSHSESHKWTREHASLFDVSHMVQHKMSGELAEEFLSTITPADLSALEKHRSTLSCLLSTDPPGGIVDDTVITRIGKDSFYFVTNAGCRDPDLKFIRSQMETFLSSKSASSDKIHWHVLEHHSLLALQGPSSQSILQKLIYVDEDDASVNPDLSTLYFGHSRWLQLRLPSTETGDMNTPSLLISRTGYTGEDGFEISIPPESGSSKALATSIAETLTADHGKVRWAGLAARDSLRLEAGMCLYGHDLSLDITPPMAALGWVVPKSRRTEPQSFNGSSVILHQLSDPKSMNERRVGFSVEPGPAAREGAAIVNPDKTDEVVGRITSGCPSPSLGGKNIAMGYVKSGWHKRGTKVGVKVRRGVRTAEVVKMPFVESKFYRPASET